MKAPNVFSRDDVLRANDAMRRQSQGGSSSASSGQATRYGSSATSAKLSSEEINRAYAEARKTLAAC